MRKSLFAILIFLCLTGIAQAKEMVYTIAALADDSCTSGYNIANLWISAAETAYGRWSLRVPKNATISSAILTLTAKADKDAGNITVTLLDSDNCPAFSGAPPGDTATTVAWAAGAWTTDTEYTIDIKTIVDAYMARPGYSYGNYMGIKLSMAAGEKLAHQYDSDPTKAMKLTVTYTEGDGIVQLWMAEPHVRTKQYVYAQIWNQDAGDKVKFYLDDSLKYTYTVLAGDVTTPIMTRWEKSYLYDYTGLSAGTHHIDVVVTTSADVERGARTTKTWTTTHSGYPKVGINEDNAFCIRDGGGTSCSLFLPMSSNIYGGDDGSAVNFDNENYYTPPNFADAININTFESGCVGANIHDIPCEKRYLDSNVTAGFLYNAPGRWLDYTPVDGATSINNATVNSTDCGDGDGTGAATTIADCSYLKYFHNHAGLFGWAWGDEWNLYGVSTATMLTYRDNTRTVDTDHPLHMSWYGYDLATDVATETAYHYLTGGFVNYFDFYTPDYYPYTFGTATMGGGGGHVISLENLLLSMDKFYAGNYGLYPTGWWIEPHQEANTGEGCPPISRPQIGDPTTAQVLNNAWLQMIHGDKALMYFGPDIPGIDFGGGVVCMSYTPAANIQALIDLKTTLTANTNKLIKMLLAPVSSKSTRQTRAVTTPTIGSVTVTLPWSAASVTGGRVDYTVREYDSKVYVIASRAYQTTENPGWPDDTNTATITATFALTGLNGTRLATRLLSSGTVTVTDGGFSDTFVPYGNEIYEIGETTAGTKFVPWRIP